MSNPSLPPTHPSYASTTSLAFKGVPINTRRQLQIATANLVATNATNVLSLDGGFTINGIPVSMQYVLSAVTHADRQKVQQQKDGDSQPQAMNPNYQRSVGQQDPTLPNTNRRQGYNTPTASNVSADSLRGSPFSPAAYSRVASPQYVGDKGQCHPHNPLTPGLSNMAYQDQTASSMASSSSGGYQAASAGHSTNHVITNNASSRQQGTHPTQYTPNLNQTSAQIQTAATSQTLQPVNIRSLSGQASSKASASSDLKKMLGVTERVSGHAHDAGSTGRRSYNQTPTHSAWNQTTALKSKSHGFYQQQQMINPRNSATRAPSGPQDSLAANALKLNTPTQRNPATRYPQYPAYQANLSSIDIFGVTAASSSQPPNSMTVSVTKPSGNPISQQKLVHSSQKTVLNGISPNSHQEQSAHVHSNHEATRQEVYHHQLNTVRKSNNISPPAMPITKRRKRSAGKKASSVVENTSMAPTNEQFHHVGGAAYNLPHQTATGQNFHGETNGAQTSRQEVRGYQGASTQNKTALRYDNCNISATSTSKIPKAQHYASPANNRGILASPTNNRGIVTSEEHSARFQAATVLSPARLMPMPQSDIQTLHPGQRSQTPQVFVQDNTQDGKSGKQLQFSVEHEIGLVTTELAVGQEPELCYHRAPVNQREDSSVPNIYHDRQGLISSDRFSPYHLNRGVIPPTDAKAACAAEGSVFVQTMQPQQLNLGIYGYGERFYTTQHFLPRWSEEVHPEAFRNDTWVYTVKARLENWDVWIKRFDDDKDKHVLTRSEYLRYAKILDDTRFAGLSAMDALDLEFSMLKFDSEMKNFVMCVLLDSFSPTPPPPLPNVPSEFRTIVSPIWRKRSRSESIDIPTTSPMSSPLAFPTTPRLRSPKSEHPSPLLLDLEPPRKFRNVETATGFMALSSLEDTFGFDILNSPPPPQFRTQIII